MLIACIGNVLRGDDGFGFGVAEELARRPLPTGVDLIETGIGGMSIVQQLMDGYDAMIVVDAVDGGATPGTVFVLDPQVPYPGSLSTDEWRQQFANLHLAEPSRILLLARAAGVLPSLVQLIGCQPERIEEYEATLTAAVQRAVPVAALARSRSRSACWPVRVLLLFRREEFIPPRRALAARQRQFESSSRIGWIERNVSGDSASHSRHRARTATGGL